MKARPLPLNGDTGAVGPRQTGVIVDARDIDKSQIRGQRAMRVHPLRAMGLDAVLVATGMRYSHLCEDVSLGSVRTAMDPLSWIRSPSSIGDGGVVSRVEAVAELREMQGRIPKGAAVSPVRNSKKRARRPATYRELVDLVCVSGASLEQVIIAYDWSPTGATTAKFKEALVSALKEMANGGCRG